ncbi:geranylgeranyl pyrophosphate synthase, partial [mine drainage metagenome]
KTMRERIDQELASFLDSKVNESIDPVVRSIVQLIRTFTLSGGKRLRPIFTVTGYSLFSKPNNRIYRAALSTEISQTYFLIQDDIMDQSLVRRGRPTFHIDVHNIMYSGQEGLQRQSESIAIIASDMADSYCHQVLLASGFTPDLLVKANLELTSIFETTGHGQLIDVNSSTVDDFHIRDLIRVHLWKTARYTIEGPLMIGAILSGTSRKIQKLSQFGYSLGLAFQLHDDYLGLFGDEKTLGKSAKSDINEGKKTLLILKAIENSSESDARFLRDTLKSGHVSDPEFERVKRIVEQSGSLEYSLSFSSKLAENAKKYIREQEGDQETKRFLEWLAEFIIKRDK